MGDLVPYVKKHHPVRKYKDRLDIEINICTVLIFPDTVGRIEAAFALLFNIYVRAVTYGILIEVRRDHGAR